MATIRSTGDSPTEEAAASTAAPTPTAVVPSLSAASATSRPEANKLWIAVGVAFALYIALAAFGAHALADRLSLARLAIYDTATEYHQTAIVIMALAALLWPRIAPHARARRLYRRGLHVALAGFVIFCATTYFLALRDLLGASDAGWVGAITPIGGVGMMIGVPLICYAAYVARA